MEFVVEYRGQVIGVYHNLVDALEAIDPQDGTENYTLVVVEEANANDLTQFLPKTINVVLVGREF